MIDDHPALPIIEGGSNAMEIKYVVPDQSCIALTRLLDLNEQFNTEDILDAIVDYLAISAVDLEREGTISSSEFLALLNNHLDKKINEIKENKENREVGNYDV